MKITMYELLGLVKDGKAPKKIKFYGVEWEYTGYQYERIDKENLGNIWNGYNFNILNEEVEILEEPKVQVELTEKEYLEYLDKINEYMESVRNYIPKPSFLKLEEEKKIPEKLPSICACSDFNENEEKLAKNINILKNKYNEIIDYLDYLKSKGDE